MSKNVSLLRTLCGSVVEFSSGAFKGLEKKQLDDIDKQVKTVYEIMTKPQRESSKIAVLSILIFHLKDIGVFESYRDKLKDFKKFTDYPTSVVLANTLKTDPKEYIKVIINYFVDSRNSKSDFRTMTYVLQYINSNYPQLDILKNKTFTARERTAILTAM